VLIFKQLPFFEEKRLCALVRLAFFAAFADSLRLCGEIRPMLDG